MTTNPAWVRIGPEDVAQTLRQEAAGRVKCSAGEVVLDFSSVRRIDAGAVEALTEVADLAGPGSGRVVLHAVNTDVYKVLKLLQLAQRFSFIS